MRSRAAVLAVDGGNSKTDAVLVDADGEVLGRARGAGASCTPAEHAASMASLARTVDAAAAAAGVDGAAGPLAEVGVFCLAGNDLPVDEHRLAAALRDTGWTRAALVRNDTFAVLRAGAERPWGVAVVCGSGLNCAGVGPDGHHVRFPAVGEYSGDLRGGGGWLGRTAMGAAVRGSDGRGPHTALERALPARLGLNSPLDVVEAAHTGRVAEAEFTALVPVVFATAADGDAVAQALVDELADEVTVLVTAAARRLGIEDTDVEVVLGGGIFQNDHAAFHDRVRAGIRMAVRRAQLRRLAAPPVVGSALLGLDRLGAGDDARARLRAALTPASMAGTVG
jgi:N-acetylglucosamine kinase-like BadF-type ATPase